MVYKYFIVSFFTLIFLGLGFWSHSLEHKLFIKKMNSSFLNDPKEKLIKYLADIMIFEKKFYQTHNRYTKLISQFHIPEPEEIKNSYSIQVLILDSNKIDLIASNDLLDENYQQMVLNQDFELHTNFYISNEMIRFLKDYKMLPIFKSNLIVKDFNFK
jgi:hypothetical protein